MDPTATFDLAYPHDLMIAYHAITPLTFVFELLGAYAILKHSPKSFGFAVKCNMLLCQLWCSIGGFIIAVLLQPVMLLPLLAGVTYGIGNRFVPVNMRLVLWLLIFELELVAMFYLVIDRHQKVIRSTSSRLKLSNNGFVILTIYFYIIYVVFGPVAAIIGAPKQERMADFVKPSRQADEFMALLDDVVVYDSFLNEYAVYAIGYLFLQCVHCVSFLSCIVPHTLHSLSLQRSSMSARTLQMHSRFIKCVLFQLCGPLFSYILPVWTFLGLHAFDIPAPSWFPTYMIISIATDSIVHTCILFSTIKPYREWLFSLVPRRKKATPVTTTQQSRERRSGWTSGEQ